MFFLTVPPHFQYQNEKKLAQPMRSFFTFEHFLKVALVDYNLFFFHIGTENWEESSKFFKVLIFNLFVPLEIEVVGCSCSPIDKVADIILLIWREK